MTLPDMPLKKCFQLSFNGARVKPSYFFNGFYSIRSFDMKTEFLSFYEPLLKAPLLQFPRFLFFSEIFFFRYQREQMLDWLLFSLKNAPIAMVPKKLSKLHDPLF